MATALLWLICGELALAGDGGTWSEGSTMFKSRSYHAATLLLNGKVLITGGFEPASADTNAYNINQTELYDPATGESSFEGELIKYRSGHTATLLPDGRVLVAGGFADRSTLTHAEIYDPSCSEPPKNGSLASNSDVTCAPWTQIQSMNYPRAAHTATLLRDGKVLVVGGARNSLPAPPPEVYDPATDKWTETPPLSTETAPLGDGIRVFHTATLLQDGRVLVLGGGLIGLRDAGFTEFTVTLNDEPFFSLDYSIHAKALNSAWLYDPTANTWKKLDAELRDARIGHTATLMPDGKVLVVGGWKPLGESTKVTLELAGMTTRGGMTLSSSELFDPVSQHFEPAGSESSGRAGHTATLLPDGRVLVTGGISGETILNTTSVYNPNLSETNRWSPATPLPESRSLHTATLLPGGRVLVVGGYKKDLNGTRVTFKFILYDANTGAWSSAGSMLEPRSDFTSTLLPDGKVLVAGGRSQTAGSGSPLPSAELYTSSRGGAGSAALANPLHIARYGHSATLLPDGKVLVAGGFSSAGEQQPLGSAEVYDPAASPPSWTQTEMPGIRGAHTATLLPTGRVLVVGGRGMPGNDSFSEEYDIAAQTWDGSSRRDMGGPCENHTATLLPDGTVLVAGGKERLTFNSKSMLYDPFTRKWTSTDKILDPPRYSHTATLLSDGKVLVAGGYSGTQPLGISELYEPSIKRWIPSTQMMTSRALHAAVLLPTGHVLVTGGKDENDMPLASAELYDPTTNSWSEAPALAHARASHSMVALPDGNVLVLGGTGSMGELSSVELYSVPRSGPFEPPLISKVEPFNDVFQNSFEPGTALSVTGERFRSGSEASGGGTSSSAVNFPLLRLRSFETGQWITPQGQKWITHSGPDVLDTSVTVPLPPHLPDGHYLLNVTSSGQSTSKAILLRNLAPPDTFFTSPSELPSEDPAASVSFQFSSSDADVHSYECSLDGADFTPCTSPHSVANLEFNSRTLRVRARDLANNVDPTPAEHTWQRPKLSHYGWGCSAGGDSLWLAGPWALLLLKLRRCRRPH